VSIGRGTARVEVFRGDHVESRHDVDFAVAASNAAAPAAAAEPVFLRSAAKPFQAAAVLAAGAADRFALTEDEIALLAASHSGEVRHTAIVAGLLAKLGVPASALRCGVHPPFDTDTATRIGKNATALHHNCSGKHAGMIALALHLGLSPDTYLDPGGPVQQAMRGAVAAACGLRPEEVVTAIDGCSALTFAVPLAAAARAFARLARPTEGPVELRAALARVAAAIESRPLLIGGSGRFDTRLVEATGGRLLSKAGAEGVQGVADRGRGLGLCLKVRDGSARAVAPATLEVLGALGWIDQDVLAALADEWRPELVNYAGKRVGCVLASVPSPK